MRVDAGVVARHAAWDQLRQEGGYWVLDKKADAVSAERAISVALPPQLRAQGWRGTSPFIATLTDAVRFIARVQPAAIPVAKLKTFGHFR
jgi:hypothetical protein